MVRNVIFDFDGVLIDSKEMYVEFLKRATQENDIEIESDKIEAELIPHVRGTINNILPKNLENRDTLGKRIEERVINLTADEGLERVRLNEDVTTTLYGLKKMGYNMFLVSNSHSRFINNVLGQYDLHTFFDDVITLDSGFKSKDEAIKRIIGKEGIETNEIAYIGDTIEDVKLGKRVGCKVIIILSNFSWDYNKKEKIEALSPDFLVDDLSDIILILDTL
jgi:HAD superfamily hydrolase (TIGR01549 family)